MEKQANVNRPKVELLLNQPVHLKLLRPKPFEGSSTYGSFLLYSVEHDGVEKAYFATPEVHAELSNHELKTGDEIILTKTASANGRRISPKIEVKLVQKNIRGEKPLTLEKSRDLLVDGLKDIMEKSVREAVEITKAIQGVPFQNEDIQKIASCLFIARTRVGA